MALAFSLIGVIRDERKWYAIIMLLVSAAFTILLLRGLVHPSVPAFRPGVIVPH